MNLGYFLNFEVQISNFNLETQILELKIPKEIGSMKKLDMHTKFPQPENKMPNKSSFFKDIEIPALIIREQNPKKHRLCKK